MHKNLPDFFPFFLRLHLFRNNYNKMFLIEFTFCFVAAIPSAFAVAVDDDVSCGCGGGKLDYRFSIFTPF